MLAEGADQVEKLARTGELDKPGIHSNVPMRCDRLLSLLTRTLEGLRRAPLHRGTA